LASLTGSESARAELETRLTASEKLRSVSHERQMANWKRGGWAEANKDTIPYDPKELVLVHSTGYELENDNDGNAVLFPAGAKRHDEFPRASVHMTVNGEVSSHLFGQWDQNNKLIISNFKDVVDANGLPDVASSVDTYYREGPGEHLTLPNPLILESRADGPLVSREGNVITYAHKAEYSDEDIAEINALELDLKKAHGEALTNWLNENLSPAERLRRVVKSAALIEKGAATVVDVGEHSTVSLHGEFDKRFTKTMHEIGVESTALHASTPDKWAETSLSSLQFSGANTGLTNNKEIVDYGEHMLSYDVGIQTIRAAIAAGYAPARPLQVPLVVKDPYDSIY
jgi:hypothetical protein